MEDSRNTPSIKIDCDCGCSVLRIDKWDDLDWGLFCMSIYRGFGESMWGRIKGAWCILRRGEFSMHEMVITKKNLGEMIGFLESAKNG